MQVVLLDDEHTARRAITAQLQAAGFVVAPCEFWSEAAVALVKDRGRPRFLVSDLDMPGIRGEDFCASVRRHWPEVTVVLFTGADEARAARAVGDLGVDYVPKARTVSALVERLRELVAQRGVPDV